MMATSSRILLARAPAKRAQDEGDHRMQELIARMLELEARPVVQGRRGSSRAG